MLPLGLRCSCLKDLELSCQQFAPVQGWRHGGLGACTMFPRQLESIRPGLSQCDDQHSRELTRPWVSSDGQLLEDHKPG